MDINILLALQEFRSGGGAIRRKLSKVLHFDEI